MHANLHEKGTKKSDKKKTEDNNKSAVLHSSNQVDAKNENITRDVVRKTDVWAWIKWIAIGVAILALLIYRGVPKVKEVRLGYFKFYCPGCKTGHYINTNPKFGGVWQFNKDLDKPTASPSLLRNTGGINPTIPICHSFIRGGRIQFLNDCTHDLAEQTIELPEIES